MPENRIKITTTIGILIILCYLPWHIIAQNITNSPYSIYGIGDLSDNTFGQHKAMGRTALAFRTPYHINISNPASYTAINQHSFLFEFGIMDKLVNLQTNSDKYLSNNININYIALALPFARWWASSIGFVPFSDVGYNINIPYTNQNTGNYSINYYGAGGINQVYLGNAWKFFNRLSIGLNISYLYGYIRNLKSVLFTENTQIFNFQEEISSHVSDILFQGGIQYFDTVIHRYVLTTGLTFNNNTKLSAQNSIFSATVINSRTNIESITESIIIDTVRFSENEHSTLDIPVNYGIGISFANPGKFLAGINYSYQNWVGSSFLGKTDSLTKSYRVSAGLEFIPGLGSSASYINKMSYRAGFHYSKTPVKLFDNQISDFGICFGLGFPVRQKSYGKTNANSSVNISINAGQRGTMKDNLIKENYFIVTLNLTLFDNNWFFKQKFD
ncbi:MAG: hypothetical protein HY738_05300 [Bacteroidia bacterium]|nr:hypothetical protein [Bacteroidia bacterium]